MALDIILIVVGITLILVSFFVSEKGDNGRNNDLSAGQANAIWTERDERIIRDRVDKLLRSRSQEIVDDAEDKMAHLSNEKIMAISEYSDQVLEKIEQNHSEVVFLYDMLNKKEDEMKELIHQIDVVKAKEQDDIMKYQMQNDDEIRELKENVIQELPEKDLIIEVLSEPEPEKVDAAEDETEQQPQETQTMANVDKTDEILRLYKEGKDAREIGKELKLGVGEVMLVINMNQVKKG